MKALPLVTVMFLVVSPVFGAVGPTNGSSRSPAFDGAAHTQAESPPNGTVHVLDTPSSELVRSTAEAHRVDFGPSLDFSTLRADGRIQMGASLERTEFASDDSIRQQLILDELSGTEQRVIALQSVQRSVIERLSDDNPTMRGPLIEPARIDAEARTLNERRVALHGVTNRTSDFSISSGWFAALERELDTFASPVRTHAVAIMTGEANAVRFSVRMGETGVVLSVVVDGEYVREACRADLRDRDQRAVTYEEALDIVAESYPTICSSRITQNGINVISVGDSRRVRINYSYRQSTAYIDTGSGRVFKESRARPLRSISTTATVTGARDGLTFTVDRIYPGESLCIQSNESETGDPVDTNVTVGLEASQENTLLGHTGSDGTLWTASPPTPYTVMVIKGNSAVVLMADPTSTPTLAANLTDTENDTSPMVTSTPTESIESPSPSRMVPQNVPGDSPTVGSSTVG